MHRSSLLQSYTHHTPFRAHGRPPMQVQRLQSEACSCSASASHGGAARRDVLLQGVLATAVLCAFDLEKPEPSLAIGFKKELKKRKVAAEEYTELEDGLKVFDSVAGSGVEVTKGTKVKVHYDCVYKGLDVVSSRQSRLLGGNRTISEPFEFVAGAAVAGVSPVKIVDSAGGLFSGQGGPTPPPALSTAVLGMRAGGKRSVLVPAELGYGKKGVGEIPPGATFEMRVEVLSIG